MKIMVERDVHVFDAVVVEEEVVFTLGDLSRACGSDEAELLALVHEGVLEPMGAAPQEWRFSGPSLQRARAALRLARDLELSPAGTALVLELLAEADALRARLRRAGLD
jgi:chaperone modulatory protein CbpM